MPYQISCSKRRHFPINEHAQVHPEADGAAARDGNAARAASFLRDAPHGGAAGISLHVLAAVAEHEREMISARIKAALQAARARGKARVNTQRIHALII
jgi:resolvase-like protein